MNGDSSLTDFSVLNRILPSDTGRIVELNGAVVSQLQTQAGAVRGGTVAFYTPGGLIIGANATFDVGNLLLTTLRSEEHTSELQSLMRISYSVFSLEKKTDTKS